MAATLAAGGKNPVTGKQVMDATKVPGVLAVMATAGLYDDSGKWLYHTGLPAKSGVGGGIIAVSPGKFGIAVVSPPLDDAGNSVRAQRAITDISNALGGNPYGARPSRSTAASSQVHEARCAAIARRPSSSCDGDRPWPGPNRRRHARQRRSDHRRDRPTRARPARVQDRRRRHAVSGVGQAREPGREASGRSGHHRRPPIPGQPRAGDGSLDHRRDPRGRGLAPDVGGDDDHSDRKELLEAARWLDRRRVQLYAVERRRAAQCELGHRVPQARVPGTAHRVAHPDAERRRFGPRRSGVRGACRICAIPGSAGSSRPPAGSRPTRASDSSCGRRSVAPSGRA